MIFDFIEGAAGREVGAGRNETRFDEILLQPRAMADISARSTATRILGRDYGLPLGIAPMGMCNLACPGADALIAQAVADRNLPVCLSSAGSSSVGEMREWCGDLAWFQLYFGQSAEASIKAANRARDAGYDTLILTVDVPEVARRVRDQQNGFNLPFRLTPRAFLDFATHPRWSLSTLAHGVPKPRNFAAESKGFDRKASRAGAEEVTEIVLALSATIDGQTTAHYIADQLAGAGVAVTSLAQGVPVGGELDYLDDGTISAALKARKAL